MSIFVYLAPTINRRPKDSKLEKIQNEGIAEGKITNTNESTAVLAHCTYINKYAPLINARDLPLFTGRSRDETGGRRGKGGVLSSILVGYRRQATTVTTREGGKGKARGGGEGGRGPNKKLPPLLSLSSLSRSSSSVVVFLLFLLHPSTPLHLPPPTHVNNTLPLPPLRLTTTPSSYYLPSPRLQKKKRYCHLTHSLSYHYE